MSNPVLQFKDVSIFQGDSLVLSDVNVEVNKGDFVYLIGKTGTGKSSFMKTLYGDLPLTKGEGHIVDYDLRTLKESEIPFLRRKLGVVFQDFKLLTDRTINDNLLFVLKATGWKDRSKMDTRIEEVLDKVDMKTKGFKFPHELSGGEQQRVAVARALMNQPAIVFADEPTGNLDSGTSEELHELIFQLRKDFQQSFGIVTHNEELANLADRKLTMVDGKIIHQ